MFAVAILTGVLISWGSKAGKINIPYLSSQKNTPPPQSTPVPVKTYSGILYKIEKKDDGGAWFTILVNEDKTVKKLGIGPNASVKMRSTKTGESDVPQEAKSSDLKVGQAITLTAENVNGNDKIVSILEMGRTFFAFVDSRIVQVSEKSLLLDWHGNTISANMGKTLKLSRQFDSVNGQLFPGKQTNIPNFLSLKKGQFVYASIDRATDSGELMLNSVMIISDK